MIWIRSIGVFLRRFIRCLCGILALLLRATCRRSLRRALPGVSSVAFFVVSNGLSIVAFTLFDLVVLTLGVFVSLGTLGVLVSLGTLRVDVDMATLGFGVSLTTLGVAGCVSCGGLVVVSKVTDLLCSVVVAVVGMLLRSSLIRCNASISSIPFLFLRSFSACVRSLSAFTIMSSGIRVGSVMYLCLKCTVSDIRLLHVLLE